MIDWLKANGVTLIGWIVGIVALATATSIQLGAASSATASNATAIEVVENEVRELDKRTTLQSAAIERLESITTRQEATGHRLDLIVVKLQTMVENEEQ